jgi:protein TonB
MDRRFALAMVIGLALHAGAGWLCTRQAPRATEASTRSVALLPVELIEHEGAQQGGGAPLNADVEPRGEGMRAGSVVPAPARVRARPARTIARSERGTTPAEDLNAAAGGSAGAAPEVANAGSAVGSSQDATGGGLDTGGGANGTAGAPGPSGTQPPPASPQRARLLAGLPCDGFFPYRAHDDDGKVNVEVAVSAAGTATGIRVMTELPSGEGFGEAAASCARFARFRPATDVAGSAVASTARLELVFRRHH